MSDDRPRSDTGRTERGLGETIDSYLRRRVVWARSTWERDAEALSTLPAGPWSAYGLLGAVVLVFSVLRLGIVDLYTESLVFLVLAVAIGLLGWSTGTLLVGAHATFDLLHSLGGLTPKTFVGRLVTYVVLYALVVSIPSTQRALHARLDRVDERYPWLDDVAAPASAVGAGMLVYLWAEVAPYLVRTAFEFSPTVVAIATVQNNVLPLAVVTFLSALAVAVGYQRRAGIVAPNPWAGGDLVPAKFVWLRRLLRYGSVVVLVSGILTSVLDFVALAVALVAADLAVPKVASRSRFRAGLLAIPYTFRLVVAFAVTFLVARFLMALHYGQVAGSQFFPLVASVAFGLFVFRLLLNVDEEFGDPAEPGGPRRGAPPVAIVALSLVIVVAAVPDVALAHDCSSLADCESGARAGTAAGMSALVLALWYWTSGVPSTFDLPGEPPNGDAVSEPSEPPGDARSGAAESEPDGRAAAARLPGAVRTDRAEGADEEADDELDTDGEVEVVEVVSTDSEEYLLLRNAGTGQEDLSGWSVEDGAGHEYVFPPGVALEPGNRYRLYTGTGTDTESTAFWGLDGRLWDAPGGRVVLKNVVGDVEDVLDVGEDEDAA